MNRSVRSVLDAVDVVALVVEAGRFGAEDRAVLELAPEEASLFLVVNKIDALETAALPAYPRKGAGGGGLEGVRPVRARARRGLAELLRALERYLPEQPAVHAADEITDRSERDLAAEFLREKLFRYLGEELPYGADVEIEAFEEVEGLRRIHAAIVVEKEG